MENILLTDQQTAAFLAIEAKDHADCLESILSYGRLAELMIEAGCTSAQVYAAITSEVN